MTREAGGRTERGGSEWRRLTEGFTDGRERKDSLPEGFPDEGAVKENGEKGGQQEKGEAEPAEVGVEPAEG